MSEKISLNEAATYLGVTKQTLRNWDKSGRLKPNRDPGNKYRFYDFDDLQRVKEDMTLYTTKQNGKPDSVPQVPEKRPKIDEQAIRRMISKLHNAIRDSYSNSSIVERFDELAKVLFLRALSEKGLVPFDIFTQLLESTEAYAKKIRSSYNSACGQFAEVVPLQFRSLKLPDATIEQCGRLLEQLPVIGGSLDLKGLAFEEVVRNTFEKGDNQQFFTPNSITEFVVQMLGDKLKGYVSDPASGTGGFLVEILKQNFEPRKLSGFEIDHRLAWITGINLLVHGSNNFEVRALDGAGTLDVKARKFAQSFDVILTNPPFGSDLSNKSSLNAFELGKSYASRRRGILFIECCLELLKPNGHLAIVIDEGVLSLPSAADVRSFLLSKYQIEAVVSLPESAFLPYANVNTSILFLKNTRPKKHQLTFFAKAENVGRKANGAPDYIYSNDGTRLINSDLPQIVNEWRTFQTVGRINKGNEAVYLVDLTMQTEANENRIDFQFHHPSRFDALSLLNQSENPVLPLFELCSERTESMIPSSEAREITLRFTGLANIQSFTGIATQVDTPSASVKSAVKKYYPGDILFARMRPNLRKSCLITVADEGYTSAECVVLVPRKDESGTPILNPELLSILLRSDIVYGQIMHKVAGIGRPRISVNDLRQIRIPVPSASKQRALLQVYRTQTEGATSLREQANSLLNEAETLTMHAVGALSSGISK